jgi:two-component system NarL family sensor kinase
MAGVTMMRGRLRRAAGALPATLKDAIGDSGPSSEAGASYETMSNRTLGVWAVVLTASVAAAVLLGSGRSVPFWVIGLLFASIALSETFPVKVGRVRYVGSDFGMWLAISLVGGWPAVLLTCLGITIDAAMRRLNFRLTICNLGTFAFVAVFGCALFEAGRSTGLALPEEAGLPIAVLVLAWATDSLNLLLLWIGSPLLSGMTLRGAFKQQWIAVLPWMTLTAALAAGTVHAYYTLGPFAVAVAVLLHGGAQVLLKTIEREERQRSEVHAAFRARDQYLADALAAEARERRKVALELHDDALQNLLVARQELAASDVGRADERVAAAIEVMRGVVTRQYQLESGPVGLRGRLEEMIDLVTSQRDFAFALEVADNAGGPVDDLLVALARELVVNATKHSGGSRVQVHVACEDDFVLLSVADDGHGFEPGDVNGRLRDGHLGLAVVEDRVTAQGGRVDFAATPTGGASVRVRLPRVATTG